MAEEFVRQTWPLTSGLNEDDNPLRLQRGDLTIATNIAFKGGTVGTRPGIERDDDYDAQIAATPDILGIHEYLRNNDADRELIVIAGAAIHTDDTTTLALGGATVTAGENNYWTFAQHGGVLYAAGGGNQDDLLRIDGSAGTPSTVAPVTAPVDLSANALTATYIFQKWNRVFLAGFTDQATGNLALDLSSNPMIVRYSQLNQPEVFPVCNTIGGTSAIGGLSAYGDEFITGFGDFTDNSGDWLLILTNKRLYHVSQSGDPLAPLIVNPSKGVIANGCVSQRAYVSLGLDSSDAIYLSDRGVHSVRQSQQFGSRADSFISWKIRDTFQTINFNAIGNAVGVYDNENGRVIFAVPTGTSTRNDTLLVLDIKGQDVTTAANARWTVWKVAGGSTARITNVLAEGKASNGDSYIFFGNLDGDVGRFHRGTTTYSDFGTAYSTVLQTHFDVFDVAGVRKKLGDVHIYIQPGGGWEPILLPVLDWGNATGTSCPIQMPIPTGAQWGPTGSATWNQFTWGSELDPLFRDKLSIFGEGDSIAFRISHTGVDEPFFIAGMAFQVARSGEAIGDET